MPALPWRAANCRRWQSAAASWHSTFQAWQGHAPGVADSRHRESQIPRTAAKEELDRFPWKKEAFSCPFPAVSGSEKPIGRRGGGCLTTAPVACPNGGHCNVAGLGRSSSRRLYSIAIR